MFEFLKLWWKEAQLDRHYRPRIKKAQALRNREELELLDTQYRYKRASLAEDRRLFYQSRVLKRARRLGIYVPDEFNNKDDWEKSEVNGAMFLKGRALKDLREEIYEELKARREMAVGWIGPLTGLIGALTGLAAVLVSR